LVAGAGGGRSLRFPSLDQAVDEAISSLKSVEDDFAWAKPLVEEGLADLDRGEAISAEEVFARIKAQLRTKS
jgi:antitoxin ParD1/3/4